MSKFVTFALVALQISALSARPPCICTDEYKPVCGTDGVTYPNSSNLNCARSTNTEIEVAHDGACAEKVKVAEPRFPSCICTREMKPVCGSDGHSYNNECLLNCMKSQGNEDLTIASRGRCESADAPCTLDYKPVCGTDGVTYPNRCAMGSNRSGIEVAHEGACVDNVKVAEPALPACICTRDMKPVCGSNGVTYNNACLLNCATANDNLLSIMHAGSCENVLVAEPYYN